MKDIFMLEAIRLAKKGIGYTNPNPIVGAIIVSDGEIIGRGYHKKAGKNHAEVNAINDALKKSDDLSDCTIYVTLEPCSSYGRTPPCTGAIIEAGIKSVVIGTLDPDRRHAGNGVKILRDEGINVRFGVEKEKCFEANEAFFHWVIAGKPFVILKMAMTLDGKIATEEGESKWITGPVARRRVQELRKWADAILVGANTVRKDKPSLTVRGSDNKILTDWRQPRRLVASRTLKDKELETFFNGGNIPEVVAADSKGDWKILLSRLGAEEVTALLIEGGGELAAQVLKAGIVNKVEFHIAPKILSGRSSRPVIGGDDPLSLAEAAQLKSVKTKRLGEDIMISGYL